MSIEEHPLLASFGQMMALQTQYVAGEITAVEFGQGLASHVTEDFEFWSNFTPASDLVKPLFAAREGVDGLLERYEIEHELERIEPGTTEPNDFAVGDDSIYFSMRETAAFGNGPKVTFEVVVKAKFVEDRVARFEMYVDGRPIDAAYPAEPD